MRFKVDENLPVEVADLFRQGGFETSTVLEERLGGSPDTKILSICQSEKRVLITLDNDFGNMRIYPPTEFDGIVVLRLRKQDKPYTLEVLRRLIPLLSTETLPGYLWVVDEKRIRIRQEH
ncbi:DUF5615 family PIN-like protein [Desulfoferrobacter suflitae]|uniref:DUF5615 family PIN-like protein n=1 Tax=Desulfoferrobacter suflitae TaxID=2865782 RepID=UPI00216400F4|nr:DUF5615 family PIN-like protein [Desulfoferrobacter suflitae]MCK8600503.1 DUF5615 family PIN-like protein [Desulfoferrobacter suflitae]